jgi:hypothetical protein
MTRNQATISLPIEHTLQLRQLADALQITLSGLVGRLIKHEIDQGTLPDATPGFAIAGRSGSVSLAIEGISEPFDLSAIEAEGFAASLDAAAGKASGAAALPLANCGMITVSRKGRGVVIDLDRLDGTAQQRRTVVPDIARDLARQLRSAADRAVSA